MGARESKKMMNCRVVFTVEDGYFCPALSKAVKTMKKGEKVVLSVKPQLKVIGKLQDGTLFLKKGHDDERELFEFKTDKAIDGFDKAILIMKKGEVTLLTVAPEYGFGSSESQQELAVVPSNSTLYYEVELVSFEKWDTGYKRNEDSMLMFGANQKIVEAQAARKKEESYFSTI
ncbi:peptidyl-prolyl cis-trans isomerase FKBP62-like [Phaseolus vulgaris]|uniref:peptidyl-prolyl cis-trans isomerase FKBP62-like n=1 Tax=Phaseolus vulgaris TaxID=3885 RepID=UPI0035CA58D4